MYIRRKVFSHIEGQEREYSSKAQKALRKAYDIKKATEAGIKGSKKELLREGRKLNDRLANIGPSVNESINSKAVNTDNFLTSGGYETASGSRLASKKAMRLMGGKKYLKKNNLSGYDHGGQSSPSWNKEEMELSRDYFYNRFGLPK